MKELFSYQMLTQDNDQIEVRIGVDDEKPRVRFQVIHVSHSATDPSQCIRFDLGICELLKLLVGVRRSAVNAAHTFWSNRDSPRQPVETARSN